jgi:hypothetical protein
MGGMEKYEDARLRTKLKAYMGQVRKGRGFKGRKGTKGI